MMLYFVLILCLLNVYFWREQTNIGIFFCRLLLCNGRHLLNSHFAGFSRFLFFCVFGASFFKDMAPWWGKPSSKEVKKKKTNRESIFDMIQRKLKNVSEVKSNYKSGGSRRHRSCSISKKGSRSFGPSTRSSSSSPTVSRCLSFADHHYSRPYPVIGSPLHTVSNANSGIILTSKLERATEDPTSRPSIYFPLPEPGYLTMKIETEPPLTDVEGDLVTASVSCDSSIDSGDSSDSHLVSPLASDCENRNRATINTSKR